MYNIISKYLTIIAILVILPGVIFLGSCGQNGASDGQNAVEATTEPAQEIDIQETESTESEISPTETESTEDAGDATENDEAVQNTGGNPVVIIKTSKGDIKVELNKEKAPISVDNFLSYVEDGYYDGTIFHRVINNFMVQGGGFTADGQQKPTKAPIKNEADNGLGNDRGTIAMARTAVVDSATSQFYINQVDNDFLNHGKRDFGYAVFGKVVDGMDVVDAIAALPTGPGDVPDEKVIIESVTVVE